MTLKINTLANILVPEVKEYIVIRIIDEYTILKSKLENFEEQSWYYKKGNNHHKRLKDLKTNFESIKEDFNSMDVDDLIENINEYKERLKKCESKTLPVFVKIIGSQSVAHQINYFSELLALKSKIAHMESIDYYINRPDEVMNFA